MNNQVVSVDDTGLAPQESAALRESLEEQRRFRLAQLRELGASRHEERSADRDEVGARIVASARMVLADVEAALQRMDRNRYGTCHLCAHPISLRRLQIVPQARYCARCQQVKEAGR